MIRVIFRVLYTLLILANLACVVVSGLSAWLNILAILFMLVAWSKLEQWG